MVKQTAVVLQVPTTDACVGKLTLTNQSQPSWADEAGLFVGYQGVSSPKRVAGVLARAMQIGDPHWKFAQIRLRPAPSFSCEKVDGLKALRVFDLKKVRAATKIEMGKLWFAAAAAWLRARNESIEQLNDVDFNDPYSYIPAFPECAASVFEALPDLDVIVGPVMSTVTQELEWVAITQASKLERLTEQAYVDLYPTSVSVRWKDRAGSIHDLELPLKQV